jgi:hypothetical protein
MVYIRSSNESEQETNDETRNESVVSKFCTSHLKFRPQSRFFFEEADDGIQSVSSKRQGLDSVSTVPATALVTALVTARSFTRSCELSFGALSFFLALYTCTKSQRSIRMN